MHLAHADECGDLMSTTETSGQRIAREWMPRDVMINHGKQQDLARRIDAAIKTETANARNHALLQAAATLWAADHIVQGLISGPLDLKELSETAVDLLEEIEARTKERA